MKFTSPETAQGKRFYARNVERFNSLLLEIRNEARTELAEIDNNVNLRKRSVEKVYSGKPHCCMCGCAGKYSYSTGMAKNEHQVENKASVTRVFNTVMSDDRSEYHADANCVCLDTPTRRYVVYFKK